SMRSVAFDLVMQLLERLEYLGLVQPECLIVLIAHGRDIADRPPECVCSPAPAQGGHKPALRLILCCPDLGVHDCLSWCDAHGELGKLRHDGHQKAIRPLWWSIARVD